jgi:maltooligosyltrehalose trehalohydrolase
VPASAVFPWQRPLGAFPAPDGTVEVRVWAPSAQRVEVELAGARHALADAGHGVHEGRVPGRAGDDYRFVLDGGDPLPDPASRWQPEGLRGPSRVVEPVPAAPRAPFTPPAPRDLVIYELHVGTFSPEGTFAGAIPHLAGLAELGVTAIELMPVAEFPGRHGWGYDGVYLSAAQSSYGGPHELRALVDAAHEHGLAVLLDVVYNHVGASGSQALEAFGPVFTDKHETFWGRAINFDDAGSDGVREWVIQSAEWWVRDVGLDGLRLDAIHAIRDDSARHVLQDLTARVHAAKPGAILIAESGLNDPKVTRPEAAGGWGFDAAWADDFHHALRTLLTDERDGYYADFGELEQLAKAFRRPFVHDGSWSEFRGRRFGAPAFDRPPAEFVVFDQNHDQVGNRAFGDRLPADARPLAAFCTLLSPFVPMLFQGEEHGERQPFQFFSDHIDEEIATATREGRRREFAAFASFAEEVPDPQDPETFRVSKLSREGDPALRELYGRLLAARRTLGTAEAEPVADEAARTLRVRRGAHVLACNFSGGERRVPADGAGEVVLATHDARVDGEDVVLPARAGALLR